LTGQPQPARAQKTIFCARYLRDCDVQREIGEGPSLVRDAPHGDRIRADVRFVMGSAHV